jgi:phytanoyl-CoA hydroxylase
MAALYPGGREARKVATLEDLTEKDYQQFHELGYIAVEQALTQEQLASAQDALQKILTGQNEACNESKALQPERNQREQKDASGYRWRKVATPIEFDDRLKELAESRRLLDVVERLMDDSSLMFQDMALVKPAYCGSEKPWHQDCAYFTYPVGTTVVGVWIAIDDATPENGCMHILPGTHREGPKNHFRRRDWQICDDDVEVGRDTLVPLKAGGCMFFHGLLNHGTPENFSSQSRRALQYHYRPASVKPITEEERLKIYGGEGKNVSC